MIYYVEDDANIRELALYALAAQGMDARAYADGAEFRKGCQQQTPDLVLLDIMLPGEDGLALLSWIRSDANLASVPVMMLTAKGTEYDKVIGLDAGADDYLAKPFGMLELVSRCKALLRRSKMGFGIPAMVPAAKEFSAGPITLSPGEHRAFANGVELELTFKEFELLRMLMENRGQALTRAQLLEDVWNVTFVGETRTVDTHVQTLRHKINQAAPEAGNLIETVRGVGYRLARED